MSKEDHPFVSAVNRPLGGLYDLGTGDEDARVCKDIPPESCKDQSRNYFAYLVANLLTKVGDELCRAKPILPWLLGALGSPALPVGLLVPVREAGGLVGVVADLFDAAAVILVLAIASLGAAVDAMGLTEVSDPA